MKKMPHWSMLFAIVLLMSTVCTVDAHAVPAKDWRAWKTVGKATLKVLFFTIYDAELTSPSGKAAHHTKCAPCALNLTYRKNIDADEFLEITEEEWSRFGMPKGQMKTRLKRLKALMPSVRDGDTLSFVASPNQGDLFHGGSHLGSIEGKEFVHAFLAIWLGPKARYPKIKRTLLGAM